MIRSLISSASLALLGGLLLPSCASTAAEEGLTQAETLVDCVERIYVECELSNARAREALGSLQLLVAGDFQGDGTETYVALVESIELSEQQARGLRRAAAPLADASETFHARWQASLGTITSDALRRRSETRLTESRARCAVIQGAVDPALRAFDSLNAGLRDHATFLGHDLNAAALSDIEPEVAGLAELAGELDAQLDTCLKSTQDYLRSVALPERIEVSSAAAGGARG